MLSPDVILFAVAYSVGVSQYIIKGRRRMMTVCTIGCALWVVYLAHIGGFAGAAACMIAMIGCFIQAVVPDQKLKETFKVRMIAAVGLALAAAVACARAASDIFPLTAVVLGRFVEVQADQQRIRMGLALCQILWLFYYYSQGYLLLYCAENVAMLMNLTTIWRQEQSRKKAVLPVAEAVKAAA